MTITIPGADRLCLKIPLLGAALLLACSTVGCDTSESAAACQDWASARNSEAKVCDPHAPDVVAASQITACERSCPAADDISALERFASCQNMTPPPTCQQPTGAKPEPLPDPCGGLPYQTFSQGCLTALYCSATVSGPLTGSSVPCVVGSFTLANQTYLQIQTNSDLDVSPFLLNTQVAFTGALQTGQFSRASTAGDIEIFINNAAPYMTAEWNGSSPDRGDFALSITSIDSTPHGSLQMSLAPVDGQAANLEVMVAF